jgi:protein gp37
VSDGTLIEWTDATWNLINGCTVVSPGCTNCYAMRLAATRLKNSSSREGLARMHNGHAQWTGEILFNKRVALEPFSWKEPRRIFVCAHGDLFHASVPDAWIDYVFMVALLNPRHTLQILTKRPDRMREYMRIVADEDEKQTAGRFAVAMLHGGLQDTPADQVDIHWPPRNVWLGTSVEDQERADERVPVLLDTPAAVRWLSCEPLLGEVDLSEWFVCPNWSDDIPMDMTTGLRECCRKCDYTGIAGFSGLPIVDWVVVGGESGPGARPMHPDWARSLRDQCAAAGVPFLFKQWGDWVPGGVFAALDLGARKHRVKEDFLSALPVYRVGKHSAGRLLDDVQHDGYPA